MGKQKVVVKLSASMGDAKKRSKALKIAVGLPGVTSAALEGESGDRIVVIGDGVDPIALTTTLRKKMGYVELVSVSSADEKKNQEKGDNKSSGAAKSLAPEWPNFYPVVLPPPSYPYEVQNNNYDPSCSIM